MFDARALTMVGQLAFVQNIAERQAKLSKMPRYNREQLEQSEIVRREIVAYLKSVGGSATAQEVSDALEIPSHGARVHLNVMLKAGTVRMVSSYPRRWKLKTGETK